MGNPGAFSYAHVMSILAFIKGLGRGTHFYTASSQDTNSRLMASQLLYGTPISVPIPDLNRTDLLVVIGANPVVSHGSFLTAPRIKDRMNDVVKRGGRVVVVDPRRTETAAAFEWCGIVPDTDAYLLLSLLQTDMGLLTAFTDNSIVEVGESGEGIAEVENNSRIRSHRCHSVLLKKVVHIDEFRISKFSSFWVKVGFILLLLVVALARAVAAPLHELVGVKRVVLVARAVDDVAGGPLEPRSAHDCRPRTFA